MAATVLQLVVLDDTGDTCYRMKWPAQELARQDPSLCIINMDARAPERVKWAEKADLLVIYQSHDLELLPVLAARKARGLPTLVEYNDNFYEPPAASPVAREWSSPLLWQTYEIFMREADGVLVTGEGLASLIASKTDTPVFVLKNHLPAPPSPLRKTPKVDEPFLLGWAGSVGHAADLLFIVPLLRSLVARFPLVHLCLMGNESFPALLDVPADRLSFTPWGSMDHYYEFWRHPHIGVVPLLPTPYNRCRSDIKALEILAGGALPLLPDLVPYREFLQQTKLPSWRTLSELESLIVSYMRDKERYEHDRQSGFDYVVNHRLGALRRERLELYQSFLKGGEKGGATGYHERILPAGEEGQSQVLAMIGQAQLHLREGDGSKALAVLETLYSSPDVLFLRLLALHKSRASAAELLSHISTAERLYPLDLRFPLFVFEQQLGLEGIVQRMGRILSLLVQQGTHYRRFFQQKVTEAAVVVLELTSGDEIESFAERLLQLYPSSLNLRHALALYYERRGDLVKAQQQLQAVVTGMEALDVNHRFLQKLERAPLLCAYESLSALVAQKV